MRYRGIPSTTLAALPALFFFNIYIYILDNDSVIQSNSVKILSILPFCFTIIVMIYSFFFLLLLLLTRSVNLMIFPPPPQIVICWVSAHVRIKVTCITSTPPPLSPPLSSTLTRLHDGLSPRPFPHVGFPTQVFNIGDYRRKLGYAGVDKSFFEEDNEEGQRVRAQMVQVKKKKKKTEELLHKRFFFFFFFPFPAARDMNISWIGEGGCRGFGKFCATCSFFAYARFTQIH